MCGIQRSRVSKEIAIQGSRVSMGRVYWVQGIPRGRVSKGVGYPE